MTKSKLQWWIGVSSAVVFMACAGIAQGADKKIVLVAGGRSHGPGDHEHRAGMLLLAKVWPWRERIRAELNPRAFRNAEWVATETEAGRYVFGIFQARIEKQRAG